MKILVGNLGVKMVKATGPHRADLPREWVRLRHFHEALMEHGADALADDTYCVVCGKVCKETQKNNK